MLSACSALAWLLAWGSAADARSDVERAVRVLLIGNSYTQANLMPHLLGRLSESVRGARPLHVEAVVKGGYTLRQHLELGEAATRIRRGHYDQVVLQGHSLSALNDPFELDQSARLFHRMIERTGARTVLYATWPREPDAEFYRAQLGVRSFSAMASRVAHTYARLGGRLKARVAPVGRAFARALAAAPGLVLYRADGSHPTETGSFLAACVLYGTLTGEDPRASNYRPENVGERDAALAKRVASDALRARRYPTRAALASNATVRRAEREREKTARR
jgi:hypothetical protein